MNKDAKIQLSPAEMELVQNAELLLTKNLIIDKVYALFGDVAELVRGDIGPSPKISRGENYLGLPWVMLDYPRLFSKEDTLAVRVFFLVGKFFQYYASSKRQLPATTPATYTGAIAFVGEI